MTLIAIIFWLCVALVIYHHLGYPYLLAAIARRRRQPALDLEPADPAQYFPSVTIIVPCHNEAAVIDAKTENIARLEYPHDRLWVVLALDGCTDETGAKARAGIERVQDRFTWRIAEYPENLGKVAVLNEQINQARTDIVALSDASALVDSDALLRAARHFADPQVGTVCATYSLREGANEGERAYWAYQTNLKRQEALVAAPMGAHGAFYAFRRSLWAPLAPDTINDDFILPMEIVLQGYRAVYDEAIVASELESTAARQDFRRRVRIGAGNLQQVVRLPRLADPRHGMLAFVFLSGKGLRAVMPFILACAFGLSILLAFQAGPIFRYVLLGEILVIAIALVGWSPWSAKFPVFSRVSYLLVGHIASGLGAFLLLTGRHGGLWKLSRGEKPGAPRKIETG